MPEADNSQTKRRLATTETTEEGPKKRGKNYTDAELVAHIECVIKYKTFNISKYKMERNNTFPELFLYGEIEQERKRKNKIMCMELDKV